MLSFWPARILLAFTSATHLSLAAFVRAEVYGSLCVAQCFLFSSAVFGIVVLVACIGGQGLSNLCFVLSTVQSLGLPVEQLGESQPVLQRESWLERKVSWAKCIMKDDWLFSGWVTFSSNLLSKGSVRTFRVEAVGLVINFCGGSVKPRMCEREQVKKNVLHEVHAVNYSVLRYQVSGFDDDSRIPGR